MPGQSPCGEADAAAWGIKTIKLMRQNGRSESTMEYNHALVDKLLEKSKEAFLMAIEVYNKPSIRYRVEGFSFFICNAWELMLKAHIVKTRGESEIYFKDNPERTITLEKCIKIVDTNEHSPTRKNLLRIVDLRNTSTHFIVEEYEMVYIPLFQACVFNFTEKMMEYHSVDMTEIVPQNFLTLSVSMKSLNSTEIRAKYPGQIADRLVSTMSAISEDIENNNSSFAIRVEHHHFFTKDAKKATDRVHIAKDAEQGVQIIKELTDPNDAFKYSAKKLIKEVNNRINRAGIVLKYNGVPTQFNSHHLDLFNKYFGIKENNKLCYAYRVYSAPTYSYSIQAIEFIADEIKKDPEHIIQNLKEQLKKKKS